MTRSMVRWMRVVLPNTDFAWICILCDIAIEAFYLTVLLWWGRQPDEVAFRNIRLGFLGFSACVYGISRVAMFHPIFNEDYRKWLGSAPWHAGKPLPGGPIRLVSQDLVVLAGLMLLGREPSELTLAIPLSFLISYLTLLAFATRMCGDWVFAYLLATGLGAVALAGQSTSVSFLVAASICPISLIATQRSLARFPWSFDWRQFAKLNQGLEEASRGRLGWPHDFLSPSPPKLWLPYPDGICLSLLAGWYAFVIHWHGGNVLVYVVATKAVFVAACARSFNYMRAHRPPVNFAGRIWMRRWIIPSYDVIFVAPLLAVIIVIATQWEAARLSLNVGRRFGGFPAFQWLPALCSSCGIAAGSLALCVIGPTLERWRLHAAHRIVFDAANKQANSPFIEL